MKTRLQSFDSRLKAQDSRLRNGYALLLVTIIIGVALIMATGIYRYSQNTAVLNHRNNEYHRAVAAAEAATEKIIAQVTADFRNLGDGYVMGRLNHYRNQVPQASEHPDCNNFVFEDLSGQPHKVELTYTAGSGFTVSSGEFAGLRGTKSKLRVIANAKSKDVLTKPVGSVFQDVELIRVPIYQFSIFYNVDLEFDNLPPMTVGGRVHCNTNIWADPYTNLVFKSAVSSSGRINEYKMPENPLPAGDGIITYISNRVDGASSLNLPIGTNNSLAAVHSVIEVPPPWEDPYSSIGQQRLYNKADMLVLVDNTGLTVKSGLIDSFATRVPTNQVNLFVSTNITFYNKRELKTVRTIQIDIGKLLLWNQTNTVIRPRLPQGDIRTIFIADLRPATATHQPGVRLVNGQTLLPKGFTVATPNPLYIKGHYNCPTANLGTTNTTGTVGASLAADAVTLLSTAWNDANSTLLLGSRSGADTTVNAAILSGLVRTTVASYSGGVENFPRFLEDWTGKTLTYNGSMVAMFYSTQATGLWLGIGPAPYGPEIYMPPIRNWEFDQNFLTESKLPPATPSLAVLVRGNWRMPAPYSTNVLAGF